MEREGGERRWRWRKKVEVEREGGGGESRWRWTMDFLFKDLIVWQRAMQFAKLVYGLVKQLPVEERYALADQLRRAAASVPSNIAEGNGRAGNKDYAHFLAIARGSLYETITQLELAKELGYVGGDSRSRPTLDEIYSLAGEVSRMLTTMLKKYGALQKEV